MSGAASMTRPAAVAAGRLSQGARAGLILKTGSRVGYPQPLRPGPLARLPFGWSNFSESGVEGAMPDDRLLAVVVSRVAADAPAVAAGMLSDSDSGSRCSRVTGPVYLHPTFLAMRCVYLQLRGSVI